MLNDAQRANLTVLFAALDATDDGLITLDDAIARADQVCAGFALDAASASHRGIQSAYRQAWDELLRFADADGDGMINFEEYARGFMVVDPSLYDLARAGFDLLDADGDGLISREELIAAMRMALSGGEVPETFGGSVVR